ncbi:MAG: enolase C-terminal domain-like protein [Planctomycetaceae bacterium]
MSSQQGWSRRQVLSGLGAGIAGSLAGASAGAGQDQKESAHAMSPVKIRKVRAITTAPDGIRLVVVKVETDEPGLYGLGCATFNQRPLAVVEAVDKYLDPFARGRSADDIQDMWQNAYTSSYWRNGPVLNNALSGLDMALWDIKGKRANMPVYQLLGGKCRFAVDLYTHAGGRDAKEIEDDVRKYVEQGFRHVRIQLGGYGSSHLSNNPDFRDAGFGLPEDQYMDSVPYLRSMPKVFEHVRSVFGDNVELLHDIHERIAPIDAIRLVKALEEYRPFFIEDPFPPEQNGYFKMLREQSACPIAMGELFNNPHEWTDLITGRLIDFIRVHLSQIGGLTPARKLAALAEHFAVRSAWHGPGDVSPVGHACNAHLDLAIPNFGIQEGPGSATTTGGLPGCPRSGTATCSSTRPRFRHRHRRAGRSPFPSLTTPATRPPSAATTASAVRP